MHNLNEKQIFYNLSRSKIFLSFSNMEGLGIPPIEAAIAGNKVIGYPGRGGYEYWKKPIFTEIQHGNLSKFVKEIFLSIKKNKLNKNLSKARKRIINQYSLKQEKDKLANMIKKINKIM